jgi:hypothetical protein
MALFFRESRLVCLTLLNLLNLLGHDAIKIIDWSDCAVYWMSNHLAPIVLLLLFMLRDGRSINIVG